MDHFILDQVIDGGCQEVAAGLTDAAAERYRAGFGSASGLSDRNDYLVCHAVGVPETDHDRTIIRMRQVRRVACCSG